MAHLWIPDAHEWAVLLLPTEGLCVQAGVPLRFAGATGGVGDHVRFLLRAGAEGEADAWLALAPARSSFRANGRPVAGIRALRERDELRFHGSPPFYFSAEEQAVVRRFEATVSAVHCPRCRQHIAHGAPVVRCPNAACRLVYHAQDPNCWAYASTCLCEQPTALDAGFRWTPEGV